MSILVKRLLLGIIKFYQFVLSPWLGKNCRFYPTCSDYAKDIIISEKNILKILWLIFYRIIRCNPFIHGGYDPAPKQDISKNYSTEKKIFQRTNQF